MLRMTHKPGFAGEPSPLGEGGPPPGVPADRASRGPWGLGPGLNVIIVSNEIFTVKTALSVAFPIGGRWVRVSARGDG